MKIAPPAKLLLIYVDETDVWGDARVPLYEAIVRRLFEHGIAGATVQHGIMGYGATHRLHQKRLFGIADDRPVTISVIDNETRIREILPTIRQMVTEGMVFLTDGEVIA